MNRIRERHALHCGRVEYQPLEPERDSRRHPWCHRDTERLPARARQRHSGHHVWSGNQQSAQERERGACPTDHQDRQGRRRSIAEIEGVDAVCRQGTVAQEPRLAAHPCQARPLIEPGGWPLEEQILHEVPAESLTVEHLHIIDTALESISRTTAAKAILLVTRTDPGGVGMGSDSPVASSSIVGRRPIVQWLQPGVRSEAERLPPSSSSRH